MDDSSSSSELNPGSSDDEIDTLLLSKIRVPKLSGRFRKRNVSEARWSYDGSFGGMAEVVKIRGKLLQTTGILRQGRILLHIEEVAYLMQREALKVFDGESLMNIMDVYGLLTTGEFGCSWDDYKVYSQLKTLGYIVARHNVPWSISSTKSSKCRLAPIPSQNSNKVQNDSFLTCSNEQYRNSSDKCVEEKTSRECTEADKRVTTETDKNANVIDLSSMVEKLAHELSINENARIQEASGSECCNHSDDNSLDTRRVEVSGHEAVDIKRSEVSPHEIVDEARGCCISQPQISEIYCRSADSNSRTIPHATTPGSAYPGVRSHLNRQNPYGRNCAGKCSVTQGELRLTFDVYLPNSIFKKTDPGIPEFSLCVQSDCPPERSNIQALEALNGGIPVKMGFVDCGRVSFVQFSTVQLPCMP